MARNNQGFDQDALNNAESEELRSFDKYGEPSEWNAESKPTKKGADQGREFTCGCGLVDGNGVAIEGVRVLYQVLLPKKLNFSRTKATLFKRSYKSDLRAVQIENRQPLEKKGGKKHDDWPHIHYGQEVRKLGYDEGRNDMSPQETIDYFNTKAKINLSPCVVCDFDSDKFELT